MTLVWIIFLIICVIIIIANIYICVEKFSYMALFRIIIMIIIIYIVFDTFGMRLV